MSLTKDEWAEMWESIKTIESINRKVWKKKHYRWANNINWEVQKIKKQIQKVVGQME
jgi:diadenosine tetraphosphate (Ap4A) HIT family hydrolase